ncbi:butyrophilin-like protein 9 [Spea bombifrons]|uniref:butyrophilin-like protein 9 n=1 Tax=Spea bombifrons TaxID=233779 RepID=UPI00234BCF67|nr:butyrophilin-like protein 9 [Spea bombifrons]
MPVLLEGSQDLSVEFDKMDLWRRLSAKVLHVLILLFLFPFAQQILSETLNVYYLKSPVIVTVGSVAELTFHFSPVIGTEHMTIRIYKSSSTLPLLLYSQGKVSTETEQNRTTFAVESLKSGKILLQIHKVIPSDEGIYQCQVQSGSRTATISLEVLVTAFGTDPMIRLIDYSNEGITAVCESKEWYPEPKMMWKDSKGKALMESDTQKTTSPLGLFTVKSWIEINSSLSVSCYVKTHLLNEGKQLTIYVSDNMYNRVNRCGVSVFIGIAAGILCLLLVVGWFSFQQFIVKQQLEDKRFRELEDAIRELVDMALDPETAHPRINVKEGGQNAKYMQNAEGARCETCVQAREKCTTCMSRIQKPHDNNSKRFRNNLFVLGKTEITGGVHCFEFWIDNECGIIGVCKPSVQRNERIDLINGKNVEGIRAAQLYLHFNFHDRSPHLRMYLDCDSGNMIIIDTMVTKDSLTFIAEEIKLQDEGMLFFVGFTGYNEFSFLQND